MKRLSDEIVERQEAWGDKGNMQHSIKKLNVQYLLEYVVDRLANPRIYWGCPNQLAGSHLWKIPIPELHRFTYNCIAICVFAFDNKLKLVITYS